MTMFDDSFEGCVLFYLEDCRARRQSRRTVEGKASRLGRFQSWCLANGIKHPTKLTKNDLEAYRQYINRLVVPLTGKLLETSTVRNILTIMKAFMERLYYFNVIETNIAEGFELPSAPRRLPNSSLTALEAEIIIEQTKFSGPHNVRDRAILETYYATGIRRMELSRLRLCDIDRKKSLITVVKGKGGKDRKVPIATRALSKIDEYLAYTRPRIATLKSGDTLFLNNMGEAYTESQLTYLVNKYVRRSGTRNNGACNLFRHTTATLMHENGADIRHVQEMLGHADISTTQIYAHVSIRKLREVYQQTHPANHSREW